MKIYGRIALAGMILTSTLVVTSLVLAAAADTRLADAVMNGNKAAILSLLKQGVDVNAPQGDGTTALHWAAYRGDLETTQALLKAGANVKAGTRIGSMT